MMTEKFKKDIELSGAQFEKTATAAEQYGWENDKDERNWINQYFIMTQLIRIKWTLVIITIILIITLIK